MFEGNGGGGITGNTKVTVDIDDSQSGTFVKSIVGGSYYGGGHDEANTRQSLSVDAKWLVAKTELTEETVKDVDTVMETLNDEGENGAKIYESYVLGLDPNEETSKPVIAPVRTDNPEEVTFKVVNVAVNASAGANSVTYKVYCPPNSAARRRWYRRRQ